MGPAFFTAAIYLCLGRVVAIYGEEFSRLKPKTYVYIFVTADVVSLVLQAAGGAVTSIADEDSLRDSGIDITIAGLVFQVVSLLVFSILGVEYGIRTIRGRSLHPEKRQASWKKRAFLLGTCAVLKLSSGNDLLTSSVHQAWRQLF